MIKIFSIAMTVAAASAQSYTYQESYTGTVSESFDSVVATQTVTKTTSLSIAETEVGSGTFTAQFTDRFDVEATSNSIYSANDHYFAYIDEGQGGQLYLDTYDYFGKFAVYDSLNYPNSDNGWAHFFLNAPSHTEGSLSANANINGGSAGVCLNDVCYSSDTELSYFYDIFTGREADWHVYSSSSQDYDQDALDTVAAMDTDIDSVVSMMGCYVFSLVPDDGNSSYRLCDEETLIFTKDTASAHNRLLQEFINDPCRDECNTDETCQNYVAPPDSCFAVEEVEEEEEVVEEDTTETPVAQINETVIGSIAVAASSAVLVGLIFVNL